MLYEMERIGYNMCLGVDSKKLKTLGEYQI